MSLADRLQRSWWQPRPDALAHALRPLSALYLGMAGMSRRHPPSPLPVPVLVVGNLIVGGAGKTPTVIALVQALRAAGWTPGVVSRGYGRRDESLRTVTRESRADEVGDEPLLVHLRTQAPVVVARDRHAAALALCRANPGVDLVISDDGLQHHALPRTAQVMVFDTRGAGNGLVLPAGPLREPLPHELPPATLVLYNADRASTRLPGWTVRRRLAGAVSLQDWWGGIAATDAQLKRLRGHPLVAAAGMAEPERFFSMLEAEGLSIERMPLPDHHDFHALPWSSSTADVVVTEKDAVKLRPLPGDATRVWVVALDFALDDDFIAELQRLLRRPQTSS